MIIGNMRIYGLIGYPLEHSFSRAYFTEKFAQESIDAEYRNFPIRQIAEFNSLISSVGSLTGLNVTVPYKQAIIPFLDRLSDDARHIGAVNTICFSDNGLIGYNTDWIGFKMSIEPWLDKHVTRPHALILGKGGAALAVGYALDQLGIEFRYVTRSPDAHDLSYEDLTPQWIRDHELIVNTTPLGMYPDTDSLPDIPYEALTQGHFLYDLVYNPGNTAFLDRGKGHDTQIMNGLAMLHAQAEAAWTLWESYRPRP